jgi:hypothetical protein
MNIISKIKKPLSAEARKALAKLPRLNWRISARQSFCWRE